jgi:GntR family transcriptional regulator/MocR family aminotransferase
LWPARRNAEETLIAAAAGRGVGVYGISPYYLKSPPRTGLLLGYSRLTERDIQEGIRRLSKVL